MGKTYTVMEDNLPFVYLNRDYSSDEVLDILVDVLTDIKEGTKKIHPDCWRFHVVDEDGKETVYFAPYKVR